MRRYKESRRPHPLQAESRCSLPEAVRRESELLAPVRERADFVINTTGLTLAMLQKRICEYFADGGTRRDILVNVVSFGFKYGIPIDADLVFDVRFLPNPFYIPGLGRHTGLDADVRDFVLNHPVTQEFMTKMQSLLTFLIPHYQEEGKHRLSIAIGCTGGAHRSVAICEALAAFLREQGYAISLTHRDLELEQAHWKERPEVQ